MERKRFPKWNSTSRKLWLDASQRLRELHEALSTGKVPSPVEFEIVEIDHGNHSHYYLKADFEEHGHTEDDEQDEETPPKNHKVQIDAFSEMMDVAQWLPSIAAASDLEKEQWDQVSKLSKSMKKLLNSIDADKTDSDNLEAYKKIANELSTKLSELSSFTDSNAVESGNESKASAEKKTT